MGVRLRYTILYGAMFLVCGAGLLAITAALSFGDTQHVGPAGSLSSAEQIAELRKQLADADQAHARQLLGAAAVAFTIMLVISLLAGRLIAGRVLRPLRTITAATRRITADNLHRRLAATGPDDEVKALADTIDDLLGRLEESFAAQRRFVADASHELRTPLATMRASLDVALAKPGPVPPPTRLLADRLRAELDRTEDLLEGLLLLARAQHGALDDRTTVTLASLVDDALATVEVDDPSVYVETPASLTVAGNPLLLARMVGNAVDNAFRHNRPGGAVRIVAVPSPPAVALVIESDGPPLDPAQVALLGRPFQRLGTARTGTGTGLGLSIAAAVATAHGGTLDLLARPSGGLRVTITLPAASAPVLVGPPAAGGSSPFGGRPS